MPFFNNFKKLCLLMFLNFFNKITNKWCDDLEFIEIFDK